MSRRLQILSASFTSATSRLACAARSTCNSLRCAFASVMSSVTAMTMSATSRPKRCTSSAWLVSVSSIVSCRIAACSTVTSTMPPTRGQQRGQRDRVVDVGAGVLVLAPLVFGAFRRQTRWRRSDARDPTPIRSRLAGRSFPGDRHDKLWRRIAGHARGRPADTKRLAHASEYIWPCRPVLRPNTGPGGSAPPATSQPVLVHPWRAPRRCSPSGRGRARRARMTVHQPSHQGPI
jgi:hypothetical protein